MPTLYVSEPDAINLDIVRGLLPDDWQIVPGDTAFSGEDARGCHALLIRSATTVTPAILSSLPDLKHIIRAGVGVDNIDLSFCEQQGIAVYNAPGANADAVSDYVVAMMFHALRKLHLLTRPDVEAWDRFKFVGHSMAGRRIGIIGFGHIGRQIFTKLQGFNCQDFLVYDPFVSAADLPPSVTRAATADDVLRGSDIVTLHVPLLPATKYLVNKGNLALLPEGAILINASRGGIVNEADIVAYLQDHDLTYIADTVEGEPTVSATLLDDPNIIVTPHIASLTTEADDNVVAVAIRNFLDGKAPR